MKASKIVIVCALKDEFAAVEAGLGADYRERFELIRAGVGPASAGRVAVELAARAEPPKLVVSTGFCGGLVDGVDVGDLIIGCEIVGVRQKPRTNSEKKRRSATQISRSITRRIVGQNLDQQLVEALQRKGLRARLGRMASVEQPIATIEQKRELGKHYGAHAVDMETFSLIGNAAKPPQMLFMRVVSDAVSDELPAEVGEFLDEAGRVRVTKIARFILKKPSNIKRLMELKKRAEFAAKKLTEAWNAAREINFEP